MTRPLLVIAALALALTSLPGTAAAQHPGSIGPASPLHALDLAVERANEEIVGHAFGPDARTHRQVTHAEERVAEMEGAPPAAAARAAALYVQKVETIESRVQRSGDPGLRDRLDHLRGRGDDAVRTLLDSDRLPDAAEPGLRAALERAAPAETPTRRATPTPRPSETPLTENGTPGNRTPPRTAPAPGNGSLEGNATPENGTAGGSADGNATA